jgi:BASS family bile acid:Na+ symporter
MQGRKTLVAALAGEVHRRFLWLLLGAYAAAALAPAPGLWVRDVSVGEAAVLGDRTRVTLPMLMLAFLLLSAGLGIRPSELGGLARRPLVLIAGLAANALVPLAFTFGVSQAMRLWHNPDEVQNILVGLALIASMPIAGSSTAWSQHGNGNLALSLGLVVFSTLLSPLTTPAILHAVGRMTAGDYALDLHELAASGTGAFLAVCVVLPSLLGVLVRGAAGEARLASVKPHLKLANHVTLLLLIYANTAVSLPQAVAYPDPDFLAVMLGITAGLCAVSFASGWWVGRLLGADPARRASLMFGLGMNNNGTGLVLASLALADHPRVMLPIICYNLVQHLVAGGVASALCRANGGLVERLNGRGGGDVRGRGSLYSRFKETEAGKVGLWSKADAQTRFDDFKVTGE